MKFSYFLLALPLFVACGGDAEFAVPETKEEQLALLDEKKREIRELNGQIAELERASGGEQRAVNSKLVRAEVVEPVEFRREVELQASVESEETAAVTTELPGRLVSLTVDDGDQVRKGQLIARVDVENIAAQKAELQINLDLAQDLLERQERLRKQNIGTEVQYVEARNAVARLGKSMDQLKLQESKSAILAPISGTIENKTVNVGEYVSPATPLMDVLDARSIKVVADVPENYLPTVKRGMKVRARFPSIDVERDAKIARIGRTIDPANRTFEVELDLNNEAGRLKPNMLAYVYLVDYTNAAVVAVGNETVLEEIDGREYVYVARAGETGNEQTASKVYVKTGQNDALRREILEGLSAGDTLVTEGMRSLTDGQTIRVQLAEPIAAADPAPDAPAQN